jgi:hypothetical protein
MRSAYQTQLILLSNSEKNSLQTSQYALSFLKFLKHVEGLRVYWVAIENFLIVVCFNVKKVMYFWFIQIHCTNLYGIMGALPWVGPNGLDLVECGPIMCVDFDGCNY